MAKYLEKAEVEVLVDYINDSLSTKANINDINIPADVVREGDLAEYAKKSEVVSQLPADLVKEADLADYAKKSEVISELPNDLVRTAELDNYALNSDLETVKG